MNGFLNQFPYSDFHEMNLDWIIRTVKNMDLKLDNFIDYNKIEFADPITWSIINQYKTATIVYDAASEFYYISKQPVPSGIAITNTDYWISIIPFKIDNALSNSSLNPVQNKVITNALSGEHSERVAADQILSKNLSDVTTLANNTAAESAQNKEDITSLQSALLEETTDREEGDNALNSRIDTILNNLEPGSTALDAEVIDIRTGFNAREYLTAGAEVRGSDTLIFNDLKDLRIWNGVNLFDRDEVTYGKYIDGSGNLTTSAIYNLTGFIPVNGQFHVTAPYTGNATSFWVSFFNSNKTFDQRLSYPSTFTATYTGYIRINLFSESNTNGTHLIDQIMINNGSTGLTYQPYYSAYDRFMRDNGIVSKGALPDNTDLDTIVNSEMYLINSSYTYTHSPINVGTLISIKITYNFNIQLAISFNTGDIYYRRSLNNTWSEWVTSTKTISGRIAMFGDSITWGQLGGEAPGTQTQFNTPYYVSTLTNLRANNLAEGGMGWLAEGTHDSAYDYIRNTDLTDYDFVSFAYGVNDSPKPLGTYLDTVLPGTAEETIMGSIYNTMMYMKANYPDKTLILVSPTLGCNYSSSFPVWNWNYIRMGGWSLADMTAEYKKFADYYHIPFIDLSQSPINSFNVDHLTGGANDIHPTQEGYDVLGRYIAGKLQAICG